MHRTRTIPAALALCFIASGAPVHAGVVALGLDLRADSRITQVDASGTHTAALSQAQAYGCPFFVLCLPTTGVPGAVLSSVVPSQSQQAHAAQDPYGAFGQWQDVTLSNYGSGVQSVESRTSTRYSVAVGIVDVATALQVDFRWLGSRVAAGSYYGAGSIDASSSVQVLVSRNGGPQQLVWGFDDRTMRVPGQAGLFAESHAGTDTLGAGLPAVSFETEWREMMVWGDIERGMHLGVFDFGLLQPGETFELTYLARTDLLMQDVPYASRGQLMLHDPFGLRQGQALLSVRGLDLRIEGGGIGGPAGVPEPASLGLVLAGISGLLGRRRRHAARGRAGSGGPAAGSQASTARASVITRSSA